MATFRVNLVIYYVQGNGNWAPAASSGAFPGGRVESEKKKAEINKRLLGLIRGPSRVVSLEGMVWFVWHHCCSFGEEIEFFPSLIWSIFLSGGGGCKRRHYVNKFI